ncbi:MAG: transketolase family protein [Bacillota bacterium]|nr:transketolase family protein [Bacillota bacterium]
MEKIATREAYGKTLAALGSVNKDIVVLDADLSKSTKTNIFAKEFPDRFFDMGIAEANMAATAAGLSLAGKTVFFSSFAVFATGRAFEIIRNSICYPNLNVKIAATHGGITVGEDGGSHQSIEDIAIMRVLPNMEIYVPADSIETQKIVEYMANSNGPQYLRLGRSGQPVILDDDFKFQPGKAQCLRDGKDVAIMACGIMVAEALSAAEELAKENIEAAVLNMSSIKPLDVGAIKKYAAQCGAIVTAEEHSIIGGLGSAVAEALVAATPCPVTFVGVEDRFGQSGKPADLLKEYGLTAENIKSKVHEVLKRK